MYHVLLYEDKKPNLLVGKHNHIPDSYFDPIQLKIGIKVEKEHTNDPLLAKAIAKDHLMEIPDYYTRLIKMEKQYKQERKNDSSKR